MFTNLNPSDCFCFMVWEPNATSDNDDDDDDVMLERGGKLSGSSTCSCKPLSWDSSDAPMKALSKQAQTGDVILGVLPFVHCLECQSRVCSLAEHALTSMGAGPPFTHCNNRVQVRWATSPFNLRLYAWSTSQNNFSGIIKCHINLKLVQLFEGMTLVTERGKRFDMSGLVDLRNPAVNHKRAPSHWHGESAGFLQEEQGLPVGPAFILQSPENRSTCRNLVAHNSVFGFYEPKCELSGHLSQGIIIWAYGWLF